MIIYFNDKQISTKAITLSAALEENKLHNKTGMAVAVNSEVIQKADWGRLILKEHDKILVITATQGG